MAASDVLNPTQGFDQDLGDSMNPNFGFTRKRPSTKLNKKAVGGTPWSRETQNTGHSFTLSWLGRTYACVQRLKWFSEQFEDGFFTIIDWDGGERHYLGHFTTEVTPVLTGNNKWDVQNVTFEEIPQQAMDVYPDDWDNDAIWLWPFNDYTDQKLAVNGAWTAGYPIGGANPSKAFTNPGTNATDWAQHEYRGYGFGLWMLTGPAFGKVIPYVDGVAAAEIDLYRAGAVTPALVLKSPLPLDIHRVQVVTTNTKNGASTAPACTWWGLKVMR